MARYYVLTEERPLSVMTAQDQVMVIVAAGHRIKIEGNTLYAMGKTGEWVETIDHPADVMQSLKEE